MPTVTDYAASYAAISGETGWTNPQYLNGTSQETNWATAAPARNTWYGNLFTGFDFSAIPDNSVITAVTVSFRTKESGTATVNYRSSPYVGTTAIGTAPVYTEGATAGSTTAKTQTYNLSVMPTVAQVKDANFGIRVEFTRTTTTANTGNLAWISVAVTYGPAPSQAVFYAIRAAMGTAASPYTSPSFTPAANELLVCIVAVGNGGAATTGTITVTDSLTQSWTKLKESATGNTNGYGAVWVKDAGASPSSQTVTVTATGITDCNCVVVGCSGAANAAAQATQAALNANVGSGTVQNVSVTPAYDNSYVFAGWAGRAAGLMTADANSVFLGNVNGTSDWGGALVCNSWDTAGLAEVVGATATKLYSGIAGVEIIPALPAADDLQEDTANTPAPAWSTGTTSSTLASNAFSPQAGTLVVVPVAVAFASDPGANTTVTVKDSLNNSYTESAAHVVDNIHEYAGIFTRRYDSAPGSITVTMTQNNAAGSHAMQISPRPLINAAADQSGASSATYSSTGQVANIYSTVSTTVAGSLVFVAASVFNGETTITRTVQTSTIKTVNDAGNACGVYTGRMTGATVDPAVVTLGWTVPTTTRFGWAALEILEQTGLTYTRAGGGSAIGAATGAKVKVATYSDAGGAIARGAGSGQLRYAVRCKAGGGIVRGAGTGAKIETGAVVRFGGGMAVGSANGMPDRAVRNLQGGAAARVIANGARQVTRAETGGGIARVIGNAPRSVVHPRSGAGMADGTGTGTVDLAVRSLAGAAAAVGAGTGPVTVTGIGPQTYARAGGGITAGTGNGARVGTWLRAGGAETRTAGIASRSVTRVESGAGMAVSGGIGLRVTWRIKSGAAIAAGAGGGVRLLLLTRRGAAMTRGSGTGIRAMAWAPRPGAAMASGIAAGARFIHWARAGAAIAAGAGIGAGQRTSLAKTGGGMAVAAGTGPAQVRGMVKAGGADTAGMGTGDLVLVLVTAGGADATGIGTGQQAITLHGQIVRTGGADATGMGIARHPGRIYQKQGGGCPAGLGTGRRTWAQGKQGGAAVRGCASGTRVSYRGFRGGACAVAAGTGYTPPPPAKRTYLRDVTAGAPHGRWSAGDVHGAGIEAADPHGRWSAAPPRGRYAAGSPHGRWASAGEPHG